MDHNLKVPKREQHAQYQSRRSQDDMNPQEIYPVENNLPLSQQDPGLVQSHSMSAATKLVSGHSPPSNQLQQPMLYDPHSSDDDVVNILIRNIDRDIAEAAAEVERAIDFSHEPVDDARPLDPNLICPQCAKQFRIGQIQYYRYHVDNCSK